MDEIEALTESLGLKSSRKGAPMAASKARNSRFSSSANSDLDSVLKSSFSSGGDDADKLFDLRNKSLSKEINDFFRSFESSNSEQKARIGEFSDEGGGGVSAEDWASCEELIPGFGGNSEPNSRILYRENEEGKRPLKSTSHHSIFNSESSPLFYEQIGELHNSSKLASSSFGYFQANDTDVDRWASGKQANLRALLSTLHCVVGDECGWKAVSMADLVASSSVNKFYKKAMLCVHPDKLQQRGAKFQSIKIFYILKEAHSKFSREEL